MAEKSLYRRKFALDKLLILTQKAKFASGDYRQLVRVLKDIVAEDNNTLLVAQAARCLAGLARGLGSRVSSDVLKFLLANFPYLSLRSNPW